MYCPNCGHGLKLAGGEHIDEVRGSVSARASCPLCGVSWQAACQVSGGQASLTLLAEPFPLACLRGQTGAAPRSLSFGLRQWLFEEGDPRGTPVVIGGNDDD